MFRSRNNKQKQKYQFSDLKMEKKITIWKNLCPINMDGIYKT